MTMFDERERAFESMFVHEEETRFRALARRNKLAGAWVAKQLALPDREAEAYIQQSVFAVVQPDAELSLVAKIASDLGHISGYWTESRVRQILSEFMARAVQEVRFEGSLTQH